MPASLLVCLPLLFVPAQPPGDGLAPDLPDGQPPTPNAGEVSPFDDPPADAEDPFADPPPPADAEPSVGVPMQPPTVPGVVVEPGDVPPTNPLLQVEEPAETDVVVPLDPADPGVVVVEDPALTVVTQPSPLSELIRNPYDVYDLREHVAVPAECLIARQACLPCTRTVVSCAPCGGCGACGSAGGLISEEVPVPGVNPMAAEQLGQILLSRTPEDPRVSYLMFVLRYREGRYDEAFSFLEEAVLLERADPDAFPNYGEFMTPIQGRSRVYLERVRRLSGLGVI